MIKTPSQLGQNDKINLRIDACFIETCKRNEKFDISDSQAEMVFYDEWFVKVE